MSKLCTWKAVVTVFIHKQYDSAKTNTVPLRIVFSMFHKQNKAACGVRIFVYGKSLWFWTVYRQSNVANGCSLLRFSWFLMLLLSWQWIASVYVWTHAKKDDLNGFSSTFRLRSNPNILETCVRLFECHSTQDFWIYVPFWLGEKNIKRKRKSPPKYDRRFQIRSIFSVFAFRIQFKQPSHWNRKKNERCQCEPEYECENGNRLSILI